MELNQGKCSAISFSRKKTSTSFNYLLGGSVLGKVDQVRDLGVILTTRMTWKSQVNSCVGRALKALGFVLRSSRDFSDIRILKTLYCAFVLPLLEFSYIVWSPYQGFLKTALQRVQNKFLRAVGVRLGYTYREVPLSTISGILGILPLEDRRELQDMLFIHKLINAQIDCPDLLGQIDFRTTRLTRSRELFMRKHYGTNYLCQSPMPRAQSLVNSLPDSLDIFCTSPAVFKKRLIQLKWGCVTGGGVVV